MSRRQGLVALGLTLSVPLLGAAVTPAAAAPAKEIRISVDDATLGTKYSVTIDNQSSLDGMNAIVFQKMPTNPTDVVTLAWLSKECHAGTFANFSWLVEYDFVWGQNGDLADGSNYEAGQILSADLGDSVTLDYVDDGFEFKDKKKGGTNKDELLITPTTNVPGPGDDKQGSVGIGMSGAGTFVVPTDPVISPGFTITPTYWIAFGKHIPGDVVTIDELSVPQQLKYKDGTTHATAKFDGLKWHITYD